MNLWQILADNEKQLKLLFAGIAGLYVIVQLHCAQVRDRKERALNYVEQHREGRISDANKAAHEYWILGDGGELFDKHREAQKRGELLPPVTEDIARSIKGTSSELSFYSLALFYEEVALCGRERICDQGVLCSYFFTPMMGFGNNMDYWIKDVGARLGASFLESESMVYCRCRNELEFYLRERRGLGDGEVRDKMKIAESRYCSGSRPARAVSGSAEVGLASASPGRSD